MSVSAHLPPHMHPAARTSPAAGFDRRCRRSLSRHVRLAQRHGSPASSKRVRPSASFSTSVPASVAYAAVSPKRACHAHASIQFCAITSRDTRVLNTLPGERSYTSTCPTSILALHTSCRNGGKAHRSDSPSLCPETESNGSPAPSKAADPLSPAAMSCHPRR